MKDDQRILLTKRLLREGLLLLLKTKDLDKITVTQLCSESGINRATFYRHYEQPRDVLDDLKQDIFKEVATMAEKRDFKNGGDKWLEETCNYFYENREVFKILFKYRTDEGFLSFINERFNEVYPELKNRDDLLEVDEDTLRMGTYYYAGGIYYILRQWLSEPIDKTPKEVALLLSYFLGIPAGRKG